LIDEHEFVEERGGFGELKKGSERLFEFILGIKEFPELGSKETRYLFVGTAIGGEILLFPVLRVFEKLWETIPMMEEKVEVLWPTKERVATFSVEDCRVFFAH
jgi:hypothetical protein